MTEEQQVGKYISGLKYPIQERVIFHDIFSVGAAPNKALKVERLQNRTPLFMHSTQIEESISGT